MALTRGQEARAWVNFNGTGTVAIRDSFNVSSITDNGTGDYTINFDQAMPNANYTILGGNIGDTEASYANFVCSDGTANTVSSSSIEIRNHAGTLLDSSSVSIIVFGDPS